MGPKKGRTIVYKIPWELISGSFFRKKVIFRTPLFYFVRFNKTKYLIWYLNLTLYLRNSYLINRKNKITTKHNL